MSGEDVSSDGKGWLSLDAEVLLDPTGEEGVNSNAPDAVEGLRADEKAGNGCSSQAAKLKHRLRKRLVFSRHKNKSSGSASSACRTCQAESPNSRKTASRGWSFKLCARTDSCLSIDSMQTHAAAGAQNGSSCVCTGYRRTDDSVPLNRFPEQTQPPLSSASSSLPSPMTRSDLLSSQLPHASAAEEDGRSAAGPVRLSQDRRPASPPATPSGADHFNHLVRSGARILQNSPADSRSGASHPASVQVRVSELAMALRNQLALTVSPYPYVARWGSEPSAGFAATAAGSEVVSPPIFSRFCVRIGNETFATILPDSSPQVHTQVDYIHRLVPDMLQISNCSFYWGKMDRYEAEKLLENRSEGTFLLRDSAQEEHLFSVSFRRFDRSLHARIEQWNDRFSFDSHDPGVYSSSTVCGLIEHYKDPSHCMFFEPMLTIPLHRNFPFSLQHLSRSTICSRLSYDSINQLILPKRIRSFLKEYHYKQQVRVRSIEP